MIRGKNNSIDPSSKIPENIEIGSFNTIGKNVEFILVNSESTNKIIIGDCNVINDNTRIVIGEGGLRIGDWNVFHNNMLLIVGEQMSIGHNCWFGQNTVIDSTGGVIIGNGVRVGMYSQIWTHVASGELIEGCTLFGKKKTIIEDDVWLVGSCTVSSGIILRKRSVFLNGSNITKSSDENATYRGVPAKKIEKVTFYKDISLDNKLALIKKWALEFSLIEKDLKVVCGVRPIRFI
jgi:acetyltransferase-like isoleucine patch superfamily enzyme